MHFLPPFSLISLTHTLAHTHTLTLSSLFPSHTILYSPTLTLSFSLSHTLSFILLSLSHIYTFYKSLSHSLFFTHSLSPSVTLSVITTLTHHLLHSPAYTLTIPPSHLAFSLTPTSLPLSFYFRLCGAAGACWDQPRITSLQGTQATVLHSSKSGPNMVPFLLLLSL